MPVYVGLLSWTDQGARNVKDTVQRYEAARSAAGKLGVTFKEFLWTMGAYDAVGILEAPDDATISRFILAIALQGNVRTVTMRAYSASEMKSIIGGIP